MFSDELATALRYELDPCKKTPSRNVVVLLPAGVLGTVFDMHLEEVMIDP